MALPCSLPERAQGPLAVARSCLGSWWPLPACSALLIAVFGPEGPVAEVAGFAGLALITLGLAGYWFGRFILAANRSPRDDEQ